MSAIGGRAAEAGPRPRSGVSDSEPRTTRQSAPRRTGCAKHTRAAGVVRRMRPAPVPMRLRRLCDSECRRRERRVCGNLDEFVFEPLLERDGVTVSRSPWGPDDHIGRLNWITPEATA